MSEELFLNIILFLGLGMAGTAILGFLLPIFEWYRGRKDRSYNEDQVKL